MSRKVALPPEPRLPKYQELAQRLRDRIAAGELKPGNQLPSFAQMSAEYGIGQSTLERVYVLLERDGLIVRDPGRGTFVANPADAIQTTGVVAFIDPFGNYQHPYNAYLMQGLQNGARQLGLDLLVLHDTNGIGERKVDGLIVVVSHPASFFKFLPTGIPRVSAIYPHEGISSVSANDRQGIVDEVGHLYALGHRNIGFLTTGCTSNPDVLSGKRLEAYHESLRWVRSLEAPWSMRSGTQNASFVERGREKMKEWLQDDWDSLGCTALLCQNDDTAIGVIETLLAEGYKVPGDVSVVGFDGTERAEFFRPRLTTVRVPLHEIGERSVQLLHEIIHQAADARALGPRSVVLPVALQLGDSAASIEAIAESA